MATLLFKLKGVPESEADQVRELLTQHDIDFYETPASMWGVSMEAIWIRDDSLLEKARPLIDEYQKKLQQQVKKEYQELKNQGKAPNIWSRLKDDPMQFIAFTLVVAVILYLSIKPFISLGVE